VSPTRTKHVFAILAGLVSSFGAMALPAMAGCTELDSGGNSYSVCRFDPATTQLELFNLNDEGLPFATFSTLAADLAQRGRRLTFAMNAGMYDEALRPIGLYIEDGQQKKRLNRRGGYGNFHLKPNGVFYIKGKVAGVLDTDAYARSGVKPEHATQSGPMLVVNGEIHPKFSANGTSRKVRNGVGVTDEGEVVFVLSENAVTFHAFASLFKDELKTPNALFLDGSVSSLFAVDLNRNDGFIPLGPMVGAVEIK
jgi:uncharacterized protein YigE (DUF2233 family)